MTLASLWSKSINASKSSGDTNLTAPFGAGFSNSGACDVKIGGGRKSSEGRGGRVRKNAGSADKSGGKPKDEKSVSSCGLNQGQIFATLKKHLAKINVCVEDEKKRAPLMLQGDHGPVAYRNIRVKPLD